VAYEEASGESDSRAFGERFESALTRLGIGRDACRPGSGRLIVAFSGGLDSTLLLHALRAARPDADLLAFHVDHGLHDNSAAWSAHCRRGAEALGVAFESRAVAVRPAPGESLEAVAREARYGAMLEFVQGGDLVVTAHHADDQLETVLLRLLRGAGVRGLTAVHAAMDFGAGRLLRPLLDFTRADIEAEASRRRLEWLEDPSNAEPRFDRNYLRAEVLPSIRRRWPAAGRVATRLAEQMLEAESVLAEVAAADLAAVESPDRIPVALLERLSVPRLNNALRHAIRALGLTLPTSAQLGELRRSLSAREDAEVLVSWPGAEARVWRRQLWLMQPLGLVDAAVGHLDPDAPLAVAQGELRLVSAEAGIPDRWAREGLSVSYRSGGERIRPRAGGPSRPLKQWLQEQGIVPWMRAAIPLLYHGDILVAVGDLCLAADLPHSPDAAPFWRPVWSNHAPLT